MFLLTLKSIPLFLLTFVMFLIHPLTLKTIPMFVLTFVYFCDVSDSSIDFEVTTPMFLLTFVIFLCFY